MAIAHKCTAKPATRGGTSRAAAAPKREFYVVVNPVNGVQAVIIPESLKGADGTIALSVGRLDRYSKKLSKLWGRGWVLGDSEYIALLEALVDPPFPRHTVCTLS